MNSCNQFNVKRFKVIICKILVRFKINFIFDHAFIKRFEFEQELNYNYPKYLFD